MRVLIFLPSIGYGGAERIAIASAKEYAASGHEVFVAFDHDKKNDQLSEDIANSPLTALKACIAAKNYLGNNKLNNLWILFHVIRAINKVKPDVVVLHLPYYNIGHQVAYATMKTGKKLAIVFHSAASAFQPHAVYARIVGQHLNKRLFLVAVSEDNRRNIAKSFGLGTEQVIMIYNGIHWDGAVARKVQERRHVLNAYGITDRHIVFTTIARLDIHKGFFESIYAASKLTKRLPHARFLWIGDGPQKKEFEEEVKKRHLEGYIIFGGSSDKVYDILDASDFFLFPTHFEGLSLALLEAVSRKIPIITSDVNSNVEVILHGETGLTFPAFDSCDLLEKMEWAMENQQTMEDMAEKGFARCIRLFDMGEMVNRQLALFNHIIRGGQPMVSGNTEIQ